jgi:hypothetical protein
VNGISGALTGKVSNEKVHGGLRLRSVFVNAEEKVARAKDVESLLRDGNVGAGPGS